MAFQLAFLLHSRPYRENSAIAEFFTRESGRIAAVVRLGQGQKSNKRALVQPFLGLNLVVSGHGELQTVTQLEAEPSLSRIHLSGTALFAAMYLNELLMRLLPKFVPCDPLFDCYLSTLEQLKQNQSLELSLRQFEMALLTELGQQPDLSDFAEQLNAEGHAHYVSGLGLLSLAPNQLVNNPLPQKHLAAIYHEQYSAPVLATYKTLMRQVLAEHLGDKPLQSRKLFLPKRK